MASDLNTLVIHHKPVGELALKRLLLIFDCVYLIDPIENLSLIPDSVATIQYGNMTIVQGPYGVLYNGEKYKDKEHKTIDIFDYALNKGTLKILNLRARKFFEQYWLPLRLSYDFDTGNEEILKKSKKLIEINPSPTISNGIQRGGFLSPSGVKIYPDIPEKISLFEKEDDKKYHLETQLYSVIGKINRSLAICGQYDLIPTFISKKILNIFEIKLDIVLNNSEQSVSSKFYETNNIEMQNVQHLLFEISKLTIPDNILQHISVKELVIARNNTFHELIKLRRKLISNTKFLTQHQFNSIYCDEVDQFIEKEFKPQLYNYYAKFGETFQRLLNYSSAFTFGALGATAGFCPFLSPLQVAFLSGISATVGSVVSSLPSYLKKNKKKNFKNTYSYFLEFNE